MLRSLVTAFPRHRRSTDALQHAYPAGAASLAGRSPARVFAASDAAERPDGADTFDDLMRPYAHDPFLGCRGRWVLGADETAVDLAAAAARGALDLAGIAPGDVNLLISSAVVPDRLWPGDSAPLAEALELRCPAIDVESWYTGFLWALRIAFDALPWVGGPVLVVAAGTNSRLAPVEDPFSWFLGDGAVAAVVDSTAIGADLIGSHFVGTREIAGAFDLRVTVDAEGRPSLRAKPTASARDRLLERNASYLRDTVDGALQVAGGCRGDIDVAAFPCPVPWYGEMCRQLLELRPDTVAPSTFHRLGNVGTVAPFAALHERDAADPVADGALVLVHLVGPATTAGSLIFRWGADVILDSVSW